MCVPLGANCSVPHGSGVSVVWVGEVQHTYLVNVVGTGPCSLVKHGAERARRFGLEYIVILDSRVTRLELFLRTAHKSWLLGTFTEQ